MAPPALASSNFNSFISSAIWLAELIILIHVEPSWGVIFLLADHQTMPVRHPLSSRSLLGGALLKWSVVLSFVGKIMGGTGHFRADFSIISISVVYATLHTVQMKDLFSIAKNIPRTQRLLHDKLCFPKALLRRLIWNSQLWDALRENSKGHLWTSKLQPVVSTATSADSPRISQNQYILQVKKCSRYLQPCNCYFTLHHHLYTFRVFVISLNATIYAQERNQATKSRSQSSL